jgi:hypothetical protein
MAFTKSVAAADSQARQALNRRVNMLLINGEHFRCSSYETYRAYYGLLEKCRLPTMSELLAATIHG